MASIGAGGTDLVAWKHEGDVLTAAGLNAAVMSASWVGRLGVVSNANTKKYVLITQYQGAAAAASCSPRRSPAGTFTCDHVPAQSRTSPTRKSIVSRGNGGE